MREREDGTKPLLVHIGGSHVVTRRHLEPAHIGQRAFGILARDRQQRVLRWSRLSIDEVHDRADVLPDDCGVGIGGEVADGCGVPVIAARGAGGLVHALLDDRPLAIRCQHERVQVDLKAVGDGVVVDARREPAGTNQRVAIEARARGDDTEFRRRIAGLPAATTANMDTELVCPRIETLLQGAHD